MTTKEEIIAWLQTLPVNAGVAIDEGGLTLVAPDTGAYIEVGGEPEPEPEATSPDASPPHTPNTPQGFPHPPLMNADDVEWPWCEACRSYHHPNNPTCFLITRAGGGMADAADSKSVEGASNPQLAGSSPARPTKLETAALALVKLFELPYPEPSFDSIAYAVRDIREILFPEQNK